MKRINTQNVTVNDAVEAVKSLYTAFAPEAEKAISLWKYDGTLPADIILNILQVFGFVEVGPDSIKLTMEGASWARKQLMADEAVLVALANALPVYRDEEVSTLVKFADQCITELFLHGIRKETLKEGLIMLDAFLKQLESV